MTLAPTFCTVPEWDYTLGPEVAALCDAAGYTPDANQAAILDAIFAVKDDRPAAFEVAVVAPRQNIKTGVLKMAAIGKLFLLQRHLVIWSAHEFGTAAESFRDIREIVEGSDFLNRRVKKIHLGDGRECIELPTGRLLFKARTKAAGRGLSGDDSFLDEAFALKASHMGALLPTMLARPESQVCYGSSSGLSYSDILRGVRDRGRAGDDRLAYFEWSDPEPGKGCAQEDCDHALIREGCALDDRERWRRTNPALGIRIDEESIANLRRSLPPEEFARECLGWWDEPSADEQVIDPETWDLMASDLEPSGDIFLGVDVGPNHASASIVAYGSGALALVARKPGSSWLAERLKRIVDERPIAGVLLDPAGPIGSLIPQLDELGIAWTAVEGKASVRAHGAFVQSAAEKRFTHMGEPEFHAAVMGARRRPVGDGHKWSRRDSTIDITPLVAATNALWGAGTTEQPTEPDIYFL